MLEVPILYLRDKQAFKKTNGTLRILGNAVEVAKKLGEKYKLLHIIDLDLKKGSTANFDIYDKLTYFTNIQVECENEIAAERLLELKARIVLQLPTKLPLEKWNKRLLVGIVTGKEDAGKVHDVILKNPTKENIEKYKGNRIMVFEEKWDKKIEVWAVILQPT